MKTAAAMVTAVVTLFAAAPGHAQGTYRGTINCESKDMKKVLIALSKNTDGKLGSKTITFKGRLRLRRFNTSGTKKGMVYAGQTGKATFEIPSRKIHGWVFAESKQNAKKITIFVNLTQKTPGLNVAVCAFKAKAARGGGVWYSGSPSDVLLEWVEKFSVNKSNPKGRTKRQVNKNKANKRAYHVVIVEPSNIRQRGSYSVSGTQLF